MKLRIRTPDVTRAELSRGLESSFPVREHRHSRNGIHERTLDALPAQIGWKSRSKLCCPVIALTDKATGRFTGTIARSKFLEQSPEGIGLEDHAILSGISGSARFASQILFA
jgi:hypothetical protein